MSLPVLRIALPPGAFVLVAKGVPVAVSAIEAIEVGSRGTALVRTVSGKAYPTDVPRADLLRQLFGGESPTKVSVDYSDPIVLSTEDGRGPDHPDFNGGEAFSLNGPER